MITVEQIEQLFKVDPLFIQNITGSEDGDKYVRLCKQSKELALLIVELTPESADQSAAIRKVREAMWTASAAISARNLIVKNGQ